MVRARIAADQCIRWRAPRGIQSAASGLRVVAQVWRGYRSSAPFTAAAAAKPEFFTVIVLLTLAPAMRYPPAFTQESQHVDLPSPLHQTSKVRPSERPVIGICGYSDRGRSSGRSRPSTRHVRAFRTG